MAGYVQRRLRVDKGIGRPSVADDVQFQARESVAVCGFELPPKDGSTDGSPITAVSQWRTVSIGLPGGACWSEQICVPDWGRPQCDIGSVCLAKGYVEGSGECEVVLVIE